MILNGSGLCRLGRAGLRRARSYARHRSSATALAARTSTFDAARAPIVKRRSLPVRSCTLSPARSRSSTGTTPGLRSWLLGEFRNVAVLIAETGNRDRLAERAREEVVVFERWDRTLRARNRVAMRIDLGPAEHLVHACNQAIRRRVLQLLCLLVHFRPAHTHHLHQEQLDQPVPPEHQRRELFAGRRQSHADIRLVSRQSRIGQRLDHRRRGARHDVHRSGECPIWTRASASGSALCAW